MNRIRLGCVMLFGLLWMGCGDDSGSAPADSMRASIHSFADGCWAIRDAAARAPAYLQGVAAGAGETVANEFTAVSPETASAFYFKASGLGSYLLFDQGGAYLFSEGAQVTRRSELLSDILLVDDTFESGAEWDLLPSDGDRRAYQLRHRKSALYLTTEATLAERERAADLLLEEATGCREHPEEKTHTSGAVERVTFEDGDLFGFADVHTHIFQNFAFGGGGIVHGAPYHRLGVQHALPSCEIYHGEGGRADLAGFVNDNPGAVDLASLLPALLSGQLEQFNHATEGYPEFTDWPASNRSTHQTQYYKWLERAYLSGMRLIVQLASGNQILCDLFGGTGFQPLRYSCNDMVSVDRQIAEAYNMQDYIDAQEGGPEEGWFRIVTSPAEAREVILDGKMAVVLGIEISNLFDCFLNPPVGFSRCSEEDVVARLDEYYDRGVRVLFPVHKYDNAFSAGDGQKGIIELGNIIQTGNYSSFTQQCDETVQGGSFDNGAPLVFPAANRPRDDFFAAPPFDFSLFFEDVFGTLAPLAPAILTGPTGETGFCQSHGMTRLGEFLIEQMMRRGMIADLSHLPRKSYRRAYEILTQNDYPASDTHGRDNNGILYTVGGISQAWFDRCRNPDQPATTDDFFQRKVQRAIDNGGYPGVPFGFDLNGFAGAQAPRFGPRGCATEQRDPVTYPFTSYAGDVTFHQPMVGNRVLDFNTEGFVHIGLVAEMIEDVRGDGVSDAELEPLFRSAEAYVRMWEKAERRGAEIRAAAQ